MNTNSESYEWTSAVNAISPFDFIIKDQGKPSRYIDAKSTAGPFLNPIHLSLSEIAFALNSTLPYDIFRLYHISESGFRFRVARDIKTQLKTLIPSISSLPKSVSIDSLSFSPDFFVFGVEEVVTEDSGT
jgi:hypothetical protein